MKLISLVYFLFLVINTSECSKKPKDDQLLKGRLEVKGICMNYTIALLDGEVDPDKIESKWTDEVTGTEYKNVFALANPCSFPESLNPGDEFYFKIEPARKSDCVVCLAYYPKPAKGLSIVIIDK